MMRESIERFHWMYCMQDNDLYLWIMFMSKPAYAKNKMSQQHDECQPTKFKHRYLFSVAVESALWAIKRNTNIGAREREGKRKNRTFHIISERQSRRDLNTSSLRSLTDLSPTGTIQHSHNPPVSLFAHLRSLTSLRLEDTPTVRVHDRRATIGRRCSLAMRHVRCCWDHPVGAKSCVVPGQVRSLVLLVLEVLGL